MRAISVVLARRSPQRSPTMRFLELSTEEDQADWVRFRRHAGYIGTSASLSVYLVVGHFFSWKPEWSYALSV